MLACVYLATCVFLCMHACVCACVRVCVHACVLDFVFGNSENMQTVYKVHMYCAAVHVCQNILDSIHVHFSHLYSLLPMKCVHKCVNELHRISCNSYYNYVDNTAVTIRSKCFELEREPHVFLTQNTCSHGHATGVEPQSTNPGFDSFHLFPFT